MLLFWFIDFMFKGKSLLDHTNLFSPNEYEKNNKILLKYFQWLESKKFIYEYNLKSSNEKILSH